MLVDPYTYMLARTLIGITVFVALYMIVRLVPAPDWARQAGFILLGALFIIWIIVSLLHLPGGV